MEYYCTNPMGTRFRFRPKTAQITCPLQTDSLEPRTLDLETARNVPIQQFAVIVAEENSIPVFRGYVRTYTITPEKNRSFDVVGMEALLNQRYAPTYFYPKASMTIGEMFSDVLTNQAQPGLLAMANSALLPGVFYEVVDTSKNIVKLPGWGSTSRAAFKNIFAIDYRYVELVEEAENYDTLELIDNTYYRDSSDLWIRIDNHYHRRWYDFGGLLIEDAFEAVKLGSVAREDDIIPGSLSTAHDPLGDLIIDILNSIGQYATFRDTADHTYLDTHEAE